VSPKSPTRALGYSLGGAILLTPALGLGLIAGPALGHFYAGNSGQAWTGIAIRGGSAVVTGIGWGLVYGSVAPVYADGGRRGEPEEPVFGDWAGDVGVGLFVVGIVAGVTSLVYDIATAPKAAGRYNSSHGLDVQVAPRVGARGEQVCVSLTVDL
jgi:hypothetical protein